MKTRFERRTKQLALFFAATTAFSVLNATVARATEQGTLIHFPAKIEEDWAPGETAAADAAKTFGPRAWLRFDILWHEKHYEPFEPKGPERIAKILGICKKNNLRPLMNIIPHPWPTSAWAPEWMGAPAWLAVSIIA